MNTTTQKKGPASVGALPSHGSTNPAKDMDMNVHSNITAAACTARRPSFTVDDAIADTSLLRHLLDAAVGILVDMDFGSGETRNHKLDRVNALVTIVANDCTRLLTSMEANYISMISGRSA